MQLTRAMVLATAAAAVNAATGSRTDPNQQGQSVLGPVPGAVNPTFATATRLGDGVPAFKDLPGSEYRNVPSHLAGHFITTPDSHVQAPYEAVWHCPSGRPTPCDAHVFIYDCPPCASQKGGLPALLNSLGWERSRCAPQFTTGSGSGQTHKMTAYKFRVSPGKTEKVPLQNDVNFVSFALSLDPSVDCTQPTAQGPCEIGTNGECQWNLSKKRCELARCVGFGPNRNGCLSQCVAGDLPAMPLR